MTPDEAVKKLDQAFAHRDIEAVLAFYKALQASVWITWHYHLDFVYHEDHEGHEGFGYL